MQAVAINEVNADTYDYVRTKDFVEVKNTGCVIVPEKFLDVYLDWQLEREAARRLADPDKTTYSEQEMMDMLGITQADVDVAEDLEIE